MFELRIDTRAFTAYAEKIGGEDQIKFALAQTLNTAIVNARRVLVSDWPTHVKQRNPGWPSAALRMTYATKQNLTATISDVTGRGGLNVLAKGGTEQPLRARVFAIPSSELAQRKGQRGMRARDTVRAIVQRTPRRALRITKTGLFVGQHGRLKLMYSFRPSVRIGRHWPAEVTFAEVVTTDMAAGFATQMARAMSTRR